MAMPPPPTPRQPAPVWDLPVRLFHWALAILVAAQVTTAQIGGNAMEYHAFGGYAILALVCFRLAWGFVGGRHARFRDFVRGPAAVLAHARSLRSAAVAHRGHNPLGGWSILAMLASLLTQAVSGLFANDDVMMEGPLARHVSGRASEIATAIHDFNAVVLIALVALHLLAILFYLLVKKQNLVGPMISGGRIADGDPPDPAGSSVRAAVVLAAAAALVYLVVTF